MFSNYLRIAFRNLSKYKVNTIINVSGLAVGMTCVILIGIYIQDELSFDRYHENGDRIYRILAASEGEDYPDWVGTPAPLAPAFKSEFPEIKDYVRFDPFVFRKRVLITYREKVFYEEGFVLADRSLFDVFDFELLQGDPERVLANPTDLIISESIARKYFGDDNPIGKTMSYDGEQDFIVTGVMKDVPQNSHFRFEFVASFAHLDRIYQRQVSDSWNRFNYYTYVLLGPNVDQVDLERKASSYYRTISDRPEARVFLQPLVDIHLYSKVAKDPNRWGQTGSLFLYATIAVVILLIACVNFVNIQTANAEIREKEVGMRKVLGAVRKQLVSQFLGESLVISGLGLPLALLLTEFILPSFNQLTAKSLEFHYLQNPELIAGLLLMTVIVGLLSGGYPALLISSRQPVGILKGKREGAKITMRNTLVILQFTISVVLIAGSLIISSQMRYIRTKDLGYDRENIVNIPLIGQEAKDTYSTFRNEIIGRPQIIDATATSYTPSVERWRESTYFEGRTEADQHSFFRMAGDFNLIDLFGMEVIEGRTFNRQITTDVDNAYLLNESAVKSIGWTNQDAIGKVFGDSLGRVIGVVKDFNFRSLRLETMPMAINVSPGAYQYISVKVSPGDLPGTISFLEARWEAVNPGIPFEYYFYDDEFDKLYKADHRLEIVFRSFTYLAIFIACLGLFGLASFTVRRRTKEIGIRKVLGATSIGISGLLSKEFLKLILIANIIAWPIAWLIMNSWLQNFAYHTGASLWIFALAGGLALFVALLTVSVLSIRAAVSNPVDALRYE